MKTKRMIGCFAAFWIALSVSAQWLLTGNTVAGTDWFGADVGSTFGLSFETRVNRPMFWTTNNALRMQLSGTLTGQTVNTYGGLDLSGNLGLGEFLSPYTEPAAKFHLDFASTTTLGFRPEINYGYLATYGEAFCYTGLLGTSNSGAMWSNVTGLAGAPAHFRFVYTGSDGTSTVATSPTGLELARLYPDPNLNEGYFGIGDWTTLSLIPEERLDITDRTIRLRHFMATPPVGSGADYDKTTDPLVNRFLAADPADGRVYWKTLANGCDWQLLGANSDVVTAYTGNPCPPQDAANVGIGISNPTAKLHVVRSVNTQPVVEVGMEMRLSTTTPNNFGIASQVNGAASWNYGVAGTALNAGRNIGVAGLANGSSYEIGVRGEANPALCTDFSVGVYGQSLQLPACPSGWAGYFNGRGYLNATSWVYISDSSMKTNVQAISGMGTSILGQLQPKRFDYDQAGHPSLALPLGSHFGLIAQEVESVLPELVSAVQHPAVLDSSGNVLMAAEDFKGIAYTELIAVLIAGFQEQQTAIQAMQQQLSACCTLDDGTRMQQGNGIGYIDNALQPAAQANTPLAKDDLVVIPNPFQENPTISYHIGTTGRAQLRVSSSEGRDMGLLFDAGMQAGQHTLVWNTTGMAVGTYWLTLTLDGVRITEQAVKVQ